MPPALLLLPFLFLSMAAALPSVLVYTATAGYRHDSIPTAISTLQSLSTSWNVSFSFTEDRTLFNDAYLSTFDAIMFISNSDEVLDAAGKTAFQKYLQSGGNYIGIHAASACLFNTTFYQQEVGALFDYHPELQSATFVPLNTTHPAMVGLPARWTFEEEVYYFRSDPRSVGADVLLTVDESSYTNPGNSSTGNYQMGSPHPIAWSISAPLPTTPLLQSTPRPGRSFYTSLGHLNSTWADPLFQNHVRGGLSWAMAGGGTRAFGVGVVGNGTVGGGNGTTTTTTTTGAGTGTATTGSGAGIGTGVMTGTGTGTAGTAAATTSAKSGAGRLGVSGALGVGVGVVAVGIGLGI